MGETCGMKLIMSTVPVGTKCKLCEKIDTKMRRRQAEVERISRWNREGSKFLASIEKSENIIRSLDTHLETRAGAHSRCTLWSDACRR